MELNAAYEQYGDDLTAEQIQQIVLGNALSTTVGYGIGKGINKAADKWLPQGGVDGPHSGKTSAAPPQATTTPNSTSTNSAGLANSNQLETSAPNSHRDNNQSVSEEISATPTRRSETESEVITPTKRPELEEGLAHDPKARDIVEKDPELANTLVETAPKNLNQLSNQQIEAELELADQLPSKTIRDGDYVEQTILPNDHEWNIREDRIPCRHSDEGFCLLPNGEKTPEEALMDKVHQNSKEVVDSNGTGVLKDRAATARASSPDLGAGTEISGDYQNIFLPKKDGIRKAPYHKFEGTSNPVRIGDESFLFVEDSDEFIEAIRTRYDEDLGEEMHELIGNRLRELISRDNDAFNMSHGIPGLHAEVQAVNRVLNRLDEEGVEITRDVLDRIQVATYRLTPKDKVFEEFVACPNCQDVLIGLLKGDNILTGLAER